VPVCDQRRADGPEADPLVLGEILAAVPGTGILSDELERAGQPIKDVVGDASTEALVYILEKIAKRVARLRRESVAGHSLLLRRPPLLAQELPHLMDHLVGIEEFPAIRLRETFGKSGAQFGQV